MKQEKPSFHGNLLKLDLRIKKIDHYAFESITMTYQYFWFHHDLGCLTERQQLQSLLHHPVRDLAQAG